MPNREHSKVQSDFQTSLRERPNIQPIVQTLLTGIQTMNVFLVQFRPYIVFSRVIL